MMIIYEEGEQFNVPPKWLAEHDKQIRNKVIVEILKQVIFEEELMYELGKDKGFNYSILDVDMAFRGIKEKLRQIKGE